MIRKVRTLTKQPVDMNINEASYGYAAFESYETQPQKRAAPVQAQCQPASPHPIIGEVQFRDCMIDICAPAVGTVVISKLINPAMTKQFGEFVSTNNLIAMSRVYPNIADQFNVGFDTGACTCVGEPGQIALRDVLGNYRVLSINEAQYFFGRKFSLEPNRWYSCNLKDLLGRPNQKFYAVAYPHYMTMPVQTQLQGCQLLNVQGVKHGYGDVAIFDSDNFSQLPLIADNGSAFTLHFETAGTAFNFIEKPKHVANPPSYTIFSP